MIARIPNQSRVQLPPGWVHPTHLLHRQWHARRVWQWRARQVLLTLVLAVVAVLLGAKPWVLALGLLGALWSPGWPPVRLRPAQTLLEIEEAHGAAYTTALTAREDEFGFAERLRVQAFNISRNAELPGLPWLEGLAALVIASLVLAWPTRNVLGGTTNAPSPAALEREAQTEPGSSAPVITEAGSAPGQVPPGGLDGQAKSASSGALSEGEVGALKPGGGQASEDPEALQRDFQEALERGAVRSGGAANAPERAGRPSAENRDSGQRDPSASGLEDEGGQTGANGRGNRAGTNRKPGQNGRANQPANGQGQQGSSGDSTAQGDQARGSGQDGRNQNGDPNAQGQGPGRQSGPDGRRGETALEDQFGDQGQSGEGPNAGQSQRGQAGKGSRGSSDPQAISPLDAKGEGKLEYLPGQARGNDVRSSALPLPGDARRPLTGTPGTPEYQRAVESAVQDPRLPPEYQELLRNYYR